MVERQQDLGKVPEPVNLLMNHRGPLLVNIRGLGSFTPNLMGENNTLFNYIGHAAAFLGTNMTTRLSIKTAPEHWKVHRFDSKELFMGSNMIDVTAYEAWFDPKFEKFISATKDECTDCGFYMRQCRGACRATVLGHGGQIKDGKLIGQDPQCFAPLIPK